MTLLRSQKAGGNKRLKLAAPNLNAWPFLAKSITILKESLGLYAVLYPLQFAAGGKMDVKTDGSCVVPLQISGKEIVTQTTFDIISPSTGQKLWSVASAFSVELNACQSVWLLAS